MRAEIHFARARKRPAAVGALQGLGFRFIERKVGGRKRCGVSRFHFRFRFRASPTFRHDTWRNMESRPELRTVHCLIRS